MILDKYDDHRNENLLIKKIYQQVFIHLKKINELETIIFEQKTKDQHFHF